MEYSKTEPKVCEGDVVVITSGLKLLVKEIRNGVPYGCALNNKMLTNGRYANGATAEIVCKYKKLELSDNWKTLDGNTYRNLIEDKTPENGYANRIGTDPDEIPGSITFTRKMSVEDIIKEYGDTVSEEALKTLKGIEADYEKRADEILLQSDIDFDKMFEDGLLFGACSHHFTANSPTDLGFMANPVEGNNVHIKLNKKKHG